MTQMQPSATLKTIFTAAVATYGGSNAPALDSQWTSVPLSAILQQNGKLAQEMDSVGFYGQVSVNLQTGEVIIADRGTDNLQNLITDTEIASQTERGTQTVTEDFAIAGLAAATPSLARTLDGLAGQLSGARSSQCCS